MGWGNIVIEGHCFNDEKDFRDVPCENNEQGFVGIDCIGEGKEKCRYFGFAKSRSCVVLTDHEGNEIRYDSFDCEETDSAKWMQEEARWKERWLKVFDEMGD